MTSNPYNQTPKLGGAEQIIHDGPVVWNIGQTGFPFADNSIFDYENSHRHYDPEFEWMPLEEFMRVQWKIYRTFWRARSDDIAPLNYDEYWRQTVTQSHVDRLIELLSSGTVFDALVIEVDKAGNLDDFQEGRHRSVALQQMGIRKLPVWIMHKRF